jgi:hypothetical protein
MIHFDRMMWMNEYISLRSKALWRCSKCRQGNLQLVEKEFKKTKSSSNTARLKCSNEDCRKQFVVIGTQRHFAHGNEVDSRYFDIQDYRLYPTHFQPELHLFLLPDYLTDPIKEKLRISFNHFWYDFDTCANKIRQVLELIVLQLGGNGGDLHQRIKALKGKLPEELVERLMAIKWIGNEGSHPERSFTREQILDTYELLVDTVNQIYPDESKAKLMSEFIEKTNVNKGIKNK